ncbi:hypothetical protein B296_00049633, partial [Ensete ventricosum]
DKTPYRAVCTGPPTDRYVDRLLLGGTIEIDSWRPISIAGSRFRPGRFQPVSGREKEEEGET